MSKEQDILNNEEIKAFIEQTQKKSIDSLTFKNFLDLLMEYATEWNSETPEEALIFIEPIGVKITKVGYYLKDNDSVDLEYEEKIEKEIYISENDSKEFLEKVLTNVKNGKI